MFADTIRTQKPIPIETPKMVISVATDKNHLGEKIN